MNFTRKRLNVLLSLLFCVSMTSVLLNPSWNLSVYSFGHWKLSLCSCVRCLRDGDPWFRALIEAAPKPLLSRKHRTSETDFNWWKRLQQNCNFTFFSATVDRLLETLPLVSEAVEGRPDRCRTCAVVGNSGNLKGSHYGPLIDAHDIIIRINRGQTKGYETDVGTKTTHHVMYPESAVKLHNTTNLVFFAFKMDDLLWLLEAFSPGENGSVNSRSIANKNLVMILNPAFMKYVHEDWLRKNGAYPSTGFLTLALSLQMCDEINVFGFGADKDGNWGHYFEDFPVKGLGTGVHAGKYEYSVIQQLHKMQKITFYEGH